MSTGGKDFCIDRNNLGSIASSQPDSNQANLTYLFYTTSQDASTPKIGFEHGPTSYNVVVTTLKLNY